MSRKRILPTLKLSFLVMLLGIPCSILGEAVKREIPVTASVTLKPSKSYTFKFSLWDAASGGAELWSEQKKIKLAGKTLSHRLGSVNPTGNPLSTALFGVQLWLQIDRKAKSKWTAVVPRSPIQAAAYALSCESMNGGKIIADQIADGAVTDSKITGPISASKIDATVARSSDVAESIAAHANNHENPHQVTAAQAGALEATATAGGDLSGSYPNPSVARLRGLPLASTAPSPGQVLAFNGAGWAPASKGDGTITGVTNGPGLTGGGVSGNVTVGVDFAGSGSSPTAARSDHDHDADYVAMGASAGGDLSGTFPNATVARIQGRAVAAAAPTPNQVLRWNSSNSQWAPAGIYTQIVIVSPVGTDAQNGAALTSALANITDNDATHRYLLLVEPGTYQVSSPLAMKSYVDIEGSGEKATIITKAGGASSTLATLQGAANSEVRFLTIRNTGAAAYATGVYSNAAGAGRLSFVTIESSGGTTASYCVYAGASPTLTLRNVTMTCDSAAGSAAGLQGGGADLFVRDSDITVTANSSARAIYITTSTNLDISESRLTASNTGGGYVYGIDSQSSSTVTARDVAVSASSSGTAPVVGTGMTGGGSHICEDISITASGNRKVDGMIFATSAIGEVRNASISASSTGATGADYVTGITVNAVEVRAQGLKVRTGGTPYVAYAVDADDNAEVKILGADLEASGATQTNYGLYASDGSTLEGWNLRVYSEGGTSAFGIGVQGGTTTLHSSYIQGISSGLVSSGAPGTTLKFDSCQIHGGAQAAAVGNGYTFQCSSCLLAGTAITSGTGTKNCINSSKADYATAVSAGCG